MIVPAIATLIAVVTAASSQYSSWVMSAGILQRRVCAVEISNGIAIVPGQRIVNAAHRENRALRWSISLMGQELQRRAPGTFSPLSEPSWTTVTGTTVRLWMERHHVFRERPAGFSRRLVVLGTLAAKKVVGTAALLLPAADRARYAEEYRAELFDLAGSGAGQLPQLRYALRQLRNALPVRFVLRSPRRRRAP